MKNIREQALMMQCSGKFVELVGKRRAISNFTGYSANPEGHRHIFRGWLASYGTEQSTRLIESTSNG